MLMKRIQLSQQVDSLLTLFNNSQTTFPSVYMNLQFQRSHHGWDWPQEGDSSFQNQWLIILLSLVTSHHTTEENNALLWSDTQVCHWLNKKFHPTVISQGFSSHAMLRLATGLNSLSSLGFLDIGTGIVVEVFHIVGIWPLSTHIWKSTVNTSLSRSAQLH